VGQTLGYHLVKSCYGLRLPGDDRGSWSEAFDEKIGFVEPHLLHPADPARQRMALERQAHPPVFLDASMSAAVADALAACVTKAGDDLIIAAAALDTTHMHLLLPYTGRDIDKTAKWIVDQTTKAVHRHTRHQGPVWAKGRWRGFIFDTDNLANVGRYIERHNLRRGLPAQPYPWITGSPL
jgi:hypothetical protein